MDNVRACYEGSMSRLIRSRTRSLPCDVCRSRAFCEPPARVGKHHTKCTKACFLCQKKNPSDSPTHNTQHTRHTRHTQNTQQTQHIIDTTYDNTHRSSLMVQCKMIMVSKTSTKDNLTSPRCGNERERERVV